LSTTAATVLAGFFRIGAILPLFAGPGKAHDYHMFLVYCPRHQAKVLLSIDNITAVINHPDGIHLHWRCSCGEEGNQRTSRVGVMA
jgi:hypothetical protein